MPNGNFEAGAGSDGLPAQWKTWVPSHGPIVKLADDQKHDGAHSLLIQTDHDLVAYTMSEPVPVAPGEKITLSAWCKVQDMSTTGAGTFGIAAGWMDFSKNYLNYAGYHTEEIQANRDWFQITTETLVPPRTSYLTFQLRHRAVTGKSWWDEVAIMPASPVVLRLELKMPTAEPGKTTIPAILINRDPARIGKTITVRTTPGGATEDITIGKETETTIPVAFNLMQRGRQMLTIELLDDSGKQLFTAGTEVTVPQSLVAEPVLPCYSCIEDSGPVIEDRIWVHEPDEVRKDLVLECTVRRSSDATGAAAIATVRISAPAQENRVKLNVGALDKLGKGDYVVESVLKKGNSILSSVRQDWHVIPRAQSQTTISGDGYPVVNGKKTFAMGLFDGSNFPELAKNGLNVTQNFDVGHVRRGWLPDNARMKKMLDDGMAVGMTHLFLVSHGPGCRNLDDEHLRRVQMFKNHPGVFMWYEEEGVARGDVPLDFLKELYPTVQKIAPEHPIMIGDTRDVIMKMTDRSTFFPAEYMDAGIWWWYPFPIRKGGRPGAYEGEEIGQRLELVPPSFLTEAKTKKPIYVVLQSYKKDKGRFPTDAEYRAQPYLSYIHGAKGVFWYTGSYTGGVQVNAKEAHYDYLKSVWRELRDMEPTFLSPDAKDEIKLEHADAMMSYRLKDAGDKRVLIAGNRNDRPTSATFIIPGLKPGEVNVRYENRKVQAQDGRLTDEFAVYGTHVYEWPVLK